MTIMAIPTRYRGYHFRSRLEARWAVFFDALGIEWEYEPEGFELPDGTRYLPDFWLPNTRRRGDAPGLWVEIKGKEPTNEEFARCGLLEKATGHAVALLGGQVDNGEDSSFYEVGWAPEDHGFGGEFWSDTPMLWVCCNKCGKTKFEFSEGSYMDCPECGGDCHNNPRITSALNAARSARFEFGQEGHT